MKNLILLVVFILLSLSTFAQLQAFRGDTLGTLHPERVTYGMSSDGRAGQKGSTGNFEKFAFLREVVAATSGGITQVNGKRGTAIKLAASDVGLGNVDNTTDATKPVSTPQQTALNLKADAASSVYRVNVATFAALTALTVPSGATYLVQVASDESQSDPYRVNQWYLKDSSGLTFKMILSKQ